MGSRLFLGLELISLMIRLMFKQLKPLYEIDRGCPIRPFVVRLRKGGRSATCGTREKTRSCSFLS